MMRDSKDISLSRVYSKLTTTYAEQPSIQDLHLAASCQSQHTFCDAILDPFTCDHDSLSHEVRIRVRHGAVLGAGYFQ